MIVSVVENARDCSGALETGFVELDMVFSKAVWDVAQWVTCLGQVGGAWGQG